MSSCWTGKKTCPQAQQEDMSPCWTRNTSSCWARRRVFLLKTCLLVGQQDLFSFSTRRHVCLWNKKTCLLVSNHPICIQEAPRSTQEAPRRHPRGQGHLGIKMCVFTCVFCSAKVMRQTTHRYTTRTPTVETDGGINSLIHHLNSGSWIQGPGSWMQDPGSRVLNPGFRTLDLTSLLNLWFFSVNWG